MNRQDDPKNKTAALMAVLFSVGEAMPLSQLAALIEEEERETKQRLEELASYLEEEKSGIRLVKLEKKYQLVTKPQYFDTLVEVAKHPAKPQLTEVTMETLSIIAYKQPVTKAEIERIRGVKSDHAVNKLIEYELVQEVGRLDAPGRPMLFGTTEQFLRSFQLEGKDALPAFSAVQIEDFRAEAEAEITEG